MATLCWRCSRIWGRSWRCILPRGWTSSLRWPKLATPDSVRGGARGKEAEEEEESRGIQRGRGNRHQNERGCPSLAVPSGRGRRAIGCELALPVWTDWTRAPTQLKSGGRTSGEKGGGGGGHGGHARRPCRVPGGINDTGSPPVARREHFGSSNTSPWTGGPPRVQTGRGPDGRPWRTPACPLRPPRPAPRAPPRPRRAEPLGTGSRVCSVKPGPVSAQKSLEPSSSS